MIPFTLLRSCVTPHVSSASATITRELKPGIQLIMLQLPFTIIIFVYYLRPSISPALVCPLVRIGIPLNPGRDSNLIAADIQRVTIRNSDIIRVVEAQRRVELTRSAANSVMISTVVSFARGIYYCAGRFVQVHQEHVARHIKARR